MRIVLSLYLLLFGVQISSCWKAAGENNAAPSGPKPTQNTVLPSAVNLQDAPGAPVESSSPNPQDIVWFDGKNYIKKRGWKTPPKRDTYIDESYDQGDIERLTESGKRVEANTILYDYKTPWLHSQEFYYAGPDLDYLKGKLESLSFMEMSANGKVFMYSISAEKVITPPPSNIDPYPHEDPFGYRIQDRDGDGIFETLLRRDSDIVVPNWVLK